MTLRRYRMLLLTLVALAACQHTLEAQAAEPAPSTPAPAPAKGLPDKVAKEAASKAIAALPACSLNPTGGVVNGQLKIVQGKCTELACIRTCCNTCTYTAVVSGNGPQRGLDAATLRQLFPTFPEAPLECEINVWNNQLKAVTLGVTAPEAKSAAVCLQAAER